MMGAIARRSLFRPQIRRVWSSIDITRALLGSYGKLIRNTFESEPVRSAARVKTIQIGNGFGMTVRHAVSELPAYQDYLAGRPPAAGASGRNAARAVAKSFGHRQLR